MRPSLPTALFKGLTTNIRASLFGRPGFPLKEGTFFDKDKRLEESH